MSGYEVLTSTERLKNRVFRIVTDEVRMPDGAVAERDYMRHVGAVGVVALDADENVVLVRQYRHALRRELWELPAGLIDVPGEKLAEAAARELAEEVDLRAGRYDLLADLNPSPGCSDEVIRLFLARDLDEVPEEDRHRRTHEEAGMTVARVPLAQAVTMALSGEITNAACIVGILATAQAKARNWVTLRQADEPLPNR
jgi:8-oxo-dGTP pyrophosphatase MutT (NUDIX family)